MEGDAEGKVRVLSFISLKMRNRTIGKVEENNRTIDKDLSTLVRIELLFERG